MRDACGGVRREEKYRPSPSSPLTVPLPPRTSNSNGGIMWRRGVIMWQWLYLEVAWRLVWSSASPLPSHGVSNVALSIAQPSRPYNALPLHPVISAGLPPHSFSYALAILLNLPAVSKCHVSYSLTFSLSLGWGPLPLPIHLMSVWW